MKTLKKVKKLAKNPFIRKWFFTLLTFVMLLFLCFMIYTYTNSRKALIMEYTSYSELQTERICDTLDDNFRSFSRVAALLSTNNMTQIYMFSEQTDNLFPAIYAQIYYQLQSYKEAFSAIDSIYLCTAAGTEFFTSFSQHPVTADILEDKNYMAIPETPPAITFFPREKNGLYPYLMTIYLPVSKSGQTSMVIVNIDISKISLLSSAQGDSLQKIYIISDEGQLLYRHDQDAMPESVDLVPQLALFDDSVDFYSTYVTGDNPYIYVQQHSSHYPWTYVTVTTPQSYMGRSYNFFASLPIFLPWLLILTLAIILFLTILSTHPIRTISEFLDNPLAELPEKISEPETERIIRHLINYIQTNHALSDELEKQLERQHKATYAALQNQINPHFLFNTLNIIRNMEIETLGYDHKAPEMTLLLSRLLQYALNSANLVPLKTEYFYTEMYLQILNQRYKEKLHFQIEKNEEASDILVPKLILQPLIENAVFHGCSPKLDTHNSVQVSTALQDGFCVITVRDNGVGIPPKELEALREKLSNVQNIPNDSIGLQNVVYRLYLTYGETFSFCIDSQQKESTCITLSFPVNITGEPSETCG